MALALYDITAFTEQYIVEKTTDVIFKQSPLLVRLLARRRMKFEGGTYIQRPIIFQELNGGWVSKGETFDIGYVVTDAAFAVNAKFLEINVSLFGADDVLNRGPQAAFSLVESKFANASMTMAHRLAAGIYQDGQSVALASTPYTALSNSKSIDGLLAWVDDGNTSGAYTTATDLTKSFPTIGGIVRTDLFAAGQAPVFTTAITPTAGIQGANAYVNRAFSTFTLNDINNAYGAAWFGNEFPDMIVTTQTGFNRIWNATQPNQRYYDKESDIGNIGFKAFRFNGAEVVIDKYLPTDGVNGVMYLLNTNGIELYISANNKFQFSFTGFKEAQDSIDVAGQFLFSGNMIVPGPRMQAKLVGPALL